MLVATTLSHYRILSYPSAILREVITALSIDDDIYLRGPDGLKSTIT